MPLIDPESQGWIDRARSQSRPYAARNFGNTLVICIVRDRWWAIQDAIFQRGHICWRTINPSTQRPIKLRLEAHLREGKCSWMASAKVQGPTFIIDDVLPRSEQTDTYFASRDWSAEVVAVAPGEESVITRSPWHNTHLEAAFVVYHGATGGPTDAPSQTEPAGPDTPQATPSPNPLDIDDVFARRTSHLVNEVDKCLDLQGRYEQMLRTESVPRLRDNLKATIEQLRESAQGYEQELQHLRTNLSSSPYRDDSRIDTQLTEISTKLDFVRRDLEGARIELIELYQRGERETVATISAALDRRSVLMVGTMVRALDGGRITEADAVDIVGALQRDLPVLEQRGIALPGQAEIKQAVSDPSLDVKHRLKISLPIIPMVISYETEIGLANSLNLSNAWSQLWSRVKGSNT